MCRTAGQKGRLHPVHGAGSVFGLKEEKAGASFCFMKTTLSILFLGCVLATGCKTISGSKYGDVRENAEIDSLRSDVSRLKERIEALESAVQQNRQAAIAPPVSDKEQREVREKVDAIDRALRSVESTHAAMEQRIIEDLSKRVAALMARAAPGGTSGSRVSSAGARSGGKEHVVKARETLTSIAAMYKVNVQALKEANNLSSDAIRVNQKLVIPE